MHRTHMLAFAATVFASIAFAADPPPPNLENPTDYVAWTNAEYGKGIRDNAAKLYIQCGEKFVKHPETEAALKDKDRSTWTDADRSAIQAWIDSNTDAIRLFQEAAKKGDCFFEVTGANGSISEWTLPDLASIRAVAKLMNKRAYLHLLAGRPDAAVDDALSILAAANHFQSQPSAIQFLIALAMRFLAYDVLQEIPRHAVENANFTNILERLRANDPVAQNAERQFTLEWLVYLDGAQRYTQDTDGDGKLDFAKIWTGTDGDPIPLVLATPMTLEELVADAKPLYERMRGLATKPPQAANEAAERIDAERKAKGATLVTILLPNMARCVELYHRGVVQRSAVRIILSAHAFRAKNGRWPRDLDEATANESPEMRQDPFSGKELVYRLEGDSFLLYSVGEDFKDDGGRRAKGKKDWTREEDCDAILWPLRP